MEKVEDKKKWFVIKSFCKSMWLITDNLKTFFVQGLVFSLILTIMSYVFGQKYMCVFNKKMAETMFCPNMSYMYFIYLFVKFFVICAFINIWYETTIKKATINIEYLKNSYKKIMKTFVFLICFLVLNIIPFISLAILFLRVPNPNWQVELLFFMFVSIGFWVPFLLMRFYSLFAVFLDGGNWKIFKKVWSDTETYSGKIIFSLSLILIINLILFVTVMGTFMKVSDLNPEIYNIIAEMFLGFANYFIVIILVNFCQIQKQMFLED